MYCPTTADAVICTPKAPSDEGAGFCAAKDWGREYFSSCFSLPPSKIKDFCHLPRQREACRYGGTGHSESFLEPPAELVVFSNQKTGALASATGGGRRFFVPAAQATRSTQPIGETATSAVGPPALRRNKNNSAFLIVSHNAYHISFIFAIIPFSFCTFFVVSCWRGAIFLV